MKKPSLEIQKSLTICIALVLFSSPFEVCLAAPDIEERSATTSQKPEHNDFLVGFDAYQKGDYPAAFHNLGEVLRKDPNSPLKELVYFWLSQTHYKAGNITESHRYLAMLLRENPKFPLKNNLGIEQLELWNRFQAISSASLVPAPKKIAPSKVSSSVAATEKNASKVTAGAAKTRNKPGGTTTLAGLTVTEVLAGASYIDIKFEGAVKGYKAFRQSKPERLVIDINGAKNLISPKLIAINQFGISNVRLGLHPDSVRIVLDATSSFPSYDITVTESGLRINFK